MIENIPVALSVASSFQRNGSSPRSSYQCQQWHSVEGSRLHSETPSTARSLTCDHLENTFWITRKNSKTRKPRGAWRPKVAQFLHAIMYYKILKSTLHFEGFVSTAAASYTSRCCNILFFIGELFFKPINQPTNPPKNITTPSCSIETFQSQIKWHSLS